MKIALPYLMRFLADTEASAGARPQTGPA